MEQKFAIEMAHKMLRTEEVERMCRLKAAVSMVECGSESGCKVPLRRAAEMFRVPKSTVHRHIQLNRGVVFRRRSRSKHSGTKKNNTGLYKLRIGFLVNQDGAHDKSRSIGTAPNSF